MFSLPYETTIAGVSFNNDDGSSRQEYVSGLMKGEILTLRNAATTEHPEAIAVYNKFGHQLGFLPKDVALPLRRCLIPFSSVVCMVKYVGRRSTAAPYGASIVIGQDRDSVLSKFSDIDRRMIEGTSHKPSYTYTPIQSTPKYTPAPVPQRQQVPIIPLGCLIPAILGLIIGIILATTVFK